MQTIMTRAHELAAAMEGHYTARMSIALRQAWAEAKGLFAEPEAVEIDHEAIAYDLADVIEGDTLYGDFGTKVWSVGGRSRVYVTRALSRGRRQEIGYVEIDEDGNVDYSADRIRSSFNRWAEWAEERLGA